MKRTTLIAAALAALIMATGFAAAAPGSAPVSVETGADGSDDHPANDRAQPAEDRGGNGSADDADDRDGQGPAADLPEQVPDHVSAIHDRISSFLSGDLETPLGDAVSDVTPADEGDGDAENGTESDANSTVDAESGTE